MSRTKALMDYRIAGIPCTIQLDYLFVQEPLGPNCDSDQDCYGYADVEFTVCDTKGRPAPWLAKKMTMAEGMEIEALLVEYHKEEAYEP